MNSLFGPLFFAVGFGGWQLLAVLLIALLLFGGSKLPELAKGLGKSIKEFKKASRDDEDVEVKPAPKSTEPAKADSTKTHGSN